jgi:hypothetical protein
MVPCRPMCYCDEDQLSCRTSSKDDWEKVLCFSAFAPPCHGVPSSSRTASAANQSRKRIVSAYLSASPSHGVFFFPRELLRGIGHKGLRGEDNLRPSGTVHPGSTRRATNLRLSHGRISRTCETRGDGAQPAELRRLDGCTRRPSVCRIAHQAPPRCASAIDRLAGCGSGNCPRERFHRPTYKDNTGRDTGSTSQARPGEIRRGAQEGTASTAPLYHVLTAHPHDDMIYDGAKRRRDVWAQ